MTRRRRAKLYITIHLANWCGYRAEGSHVILPHTSQRDNAGQLTRLKQSWKEADALVSHSVTRSAEGLAEVSVDEPLSPETQALMTAVFLLVYYWRRLDSRRIGTDTKLGRSRPEFVRHQPSMYHVPRARGLAASQRAAPIRRPRLSEGIVLESRDLDNEDYNDAATLWAYFSCFDIVANTWAAAGCFDVQGQDTTVAHVHRKSMSNYLFDLHRRATEALNTFMAVSVYSYVMTVDKELEDYAIGLARSVRHVLWRQPLLATASTHAHLGHSRRARVATGGGRGQRTQRDRSRTPPPRSRGGCGGGKGGGRRGHPSAPPVPLQQSSARAGSRKKRATVSKDAAGWTICKPFNDARGCRGCNGKKAHVCDVILEKGRRPCYSTKHGRQGHDPERDGKPALLSKQ